MAMIQASDEKNKLSRQPAFKLTVTLTGKVVEVIVFGRLQIRTVPSSVLELKPPDHCQR